MKRNKILINDMTYRTLENMLSDRSQTQKAIYYMIPFI